MVSAESKSHSHLTESAVDALGHVDVVASGTPAAIGTLLCLNSDRLGGADGLAQLAGDAALLAAGIASEGVLATEAGAQRSLLERVVDGGRLLKDVRQGDGEAAEELSEEHGGRCTVCDVCKLHAQLLVVYIHISLGHLDYVFGLLPCGQ